MGDQLGDQPIWLRLLYNIYAQVVSKIVLKWILFYFSVLRREALLRGTEAYYDSQLNESASFVADLKKAKIRNAKLLQVK